MGERMLRPGGEIGESQVIEAVVLVNTNAMSTERLDGMMSTHDDDDNHRRLVRNANNLGRTSFANSLPSWTTR